MSARKKETHTHLIGENNIITTYNHELTLFPANKHSSRVIELPLISEVAQAQGERMVEETRGSLDDFSRPFSPD